MFIVLINDRLIDINTFNNFSCLGKWNVRPLDG